MPLLPLPLAAAARLLLDIRRLPSDNWLFANVLFHAVAERGGGAIAFVRTTLSLLSLEGLLGLRIVCLLVSDSNREEDSGGICVVDAVSGSEARSTAADAHLPRDISE